ncbi:IS5 family transposase [Flaviaesturariibacter aridisoli]|uniref:IS5 family transposase n=2 Tax=Flaviaesturariibacter aridisoli TaxID=2545761 RepID=A0A4R4E059_9BACT|nr:IS5 family transposase [Flaviaesturariibacter aridisoli]TCZ72726.1 IS5 family transposase [Flaviaesturariibacter aridisoli]
MQTLYQVPDALWNKVATIFEPKVRRRKHSLQLIFSGIIYLLSNGCKWRSLPPQYGDYRLVWYYLNKWARYGLLDRALYLVGIQLRRRQGRSGEPSMLLIDAQSVKTVAGTGDEVGYDAGKKVKGRKRHLAVDTQGTVIAAGVTSAFVHDKTGARVLRDDVEDRPSVRTIVADGGYDGPPAFTAGGRIRWVLIQRRHSNRFSPLPVRWVVERIFSWLINYRRLAKDYEKTIVMSRAMLLMSAIHITLKKLMT